MENLIAGCGGLGKFVLSHIINFPFLGFLLDATSTERSLPKKYGETL